MILINYHSSLLLIWKHLGAVNTHENLYVQPQASVQGLMARAIGALAKQGDRTPNNDTDYHHIFLLITSYHPPAPLMFIPLVPGLEAFYFNLLP